MKKSTKFIALIMAIVIWVGSVIAVFPAFDVAFPNLASLFNGTSNGEKNSYTLSVSSTDGGLVSSEGGKYAEGELVSVVATPKDGYVFSYWADENGKCITSYNTYSVAMNQNTKLVAHFVPTPQNLVASAEKNETVTDCSEQFSFTIKCQKKDAIQYLKENLTVVDDYFADTEYEEHAKVEFEVIDLGNDEYQISPAAGQSYEKGATYKAKLPEPEPEEEKTEFMQTGVEGNSMTFSIESKNEENVVEYKEVETTVENGVEIKSMVSLIESANAAMDEVYAMVDDGLLVGEEGDAPDYLILSDITGIGNGTIICVYDGLVEVEDGGMPPLENVIIYVKAVNITEETTGTYKGKYKVTYDQPDLSEIFTDLDVSESEDFDFEEAGVELTDETIEEIKHTILSDEAFQMFIASAQDTVEEKAKESGYSVELLSKETFLDMMDIKVSSRKEGGKFIIKIHAAINIPLTKNKQQVAQISVFLDIEEAYAVKFDAKLALRKWWFIPVGIKYFDISTTNDRKTTTDFGVTISYDRGSGDAYDPDNPNKSEIDKNFEKEKIKEDIIKKFSQGKLANWRDGYGIKGIFKDNGYNTEGNRKSVKLFGTHWYVGILSLNLDLFFTIDLTLEGSLFVGTKSHTVKTDGVRINSKGITPYSNVREDITVQSDVVFAGEVGVRIGLRADASVGIVGLSKYIRAGVYAELGLYASASGFVSLNSQHSAGQLEFGFYYDVRIYGKLFSLYADYQLLGGEIPFIRYGYTEAYIYYDGVNDPNKNADLVLSKKETEIFKLDMFKVASMQTSGHKINIVTLDPASKLYKLEVSFASGEYLEYVNGLVKIKDNAPVYFTDTMTVKVTTSNKWERLNGKGIVSYLPAIKVNIRVGSMDEYYESLDTEIQRYFRNLYKNYNPYDADLLKDNFKNFVALEELSSNYIDAYQYILDEYIDCLFAAISGGRDIDKNNKNRNEEHRFVVEESDAFKSTITMIRELTKEGYEINEDDLKKMLYNILGSNVMYDTMIHTSSDSEIDALKSAFAGEGNASKKEKVLKILAEFEAENENPEIASKANELVDAIKSLLGI